MCCTSHIYRKFGHKKAVRKMGAAFAHNGAQTALEGCFHRMFGNVLQQFELLPYASYSPDLAPTASFVRFGTSGTTLVCRYLVALLRFSFLLLLLLDGFYCCCLFFFFLLLSLTKQIMRKMLLFSVEMFLLFRYYMSIHMLYFFVWPIK